MCCKRLPRCVHSKHTKCDMHMLEIEHDRDANVRSVSLFDANNLTIFPIACFRLGCKQFRLVAWLYQVTHLWYAVNMWRGNRCVHRTGRPSTRYTSHQQSHDMYHEGIHAACIVNRELHCTITTIHNKSFGHYNIYIHNDHIETTWCSDDSSITIRQTNMIHIHTSVCSYDCGFKVFPWSTIMWINAQW